MGNAISRLSRAGRGLLAVAAALPVLLAARPSHAASAVPLDEHTALMVGRHNLKLGILAFEYGITERVSIGIDSPYWAASAVTKLFAPNLHAKVALVERPDVVVSALLGGYYLRLSDGGTHGNVLSVPATVLGSVALTPELWLHGELNYNWVRSLGEGGAVNNHEVQGAVATRTGQVGLMAEYHFTRVVAAIARGRYQVYNTPLVVKGTSTIDPYTEAELQAELRPAHNHPYMAVAGMAFTWSHVGLTLAAGYGYVFIPGANIVLTGPGFVPDGSFWVTF